MKEYAILIVLVMLASCAERKDRDQPGTTTNNTKHREPEKSNSKYTLIRDNLYYDDEGNLYLKSINNETVLDKHEVWLKTVYCDTCWTSTRDGWKDITELKDFVDTATFHLDTTDLKRGADIYKDKRRRYLHKWMADGGEISIY
jgi:hypothetical protein